MSRIRHHSRFIVAIFLLGASASAVFAQSPTSTPNNATENFIIRLLSVQSETERTKLLDNQTEVPLTDIRKSLVARGDSLRAKSKFDDALAAYRAAQTVAEKINDSDGIAETLNRQGSIHRIKSEFAQALDLHEASLTRFTQTQNKAGMGAALNNIGAVYITRGEFAPALDFLRRALKLREAVGSQLEINQTLNNIALVLNTQGNFDESLTIQERILSSSRAMKNADMIGTALNNIANIRSEQGDYTSAMNSFQEALEMMEQTGDKFSQSLLLNNIAQIYFLQGNYERAAPLYEQSRKLREEIGDPRGLAITLMHLGMVRSANDEHAAALELLKQSLVLREKVGDKRGIAVTLHNTGKVLMRSGDNTAALDFIRRALAIYETLNYKDGTAQTLSSLTRAYLTANDYKNALDTAARAVAVSRETGARETLWNALNLYGQAQRALGQTASALVTFREAVSVIETVRQKSVGDAYDRQQFFQDKVAPYHQIIELLVADKKFEEAFAYAERAKARVLLDVVQNGHSELDKAMTAPEKAQETKLRKAFFAAEKLLQTEAAKEKRDAAPVLEVRAELSKAKKALDSFINLLYVAHPKLKIQRGAGEIAGLSELVKLLPDENAALLEYLVTENRVFIFLVSPDKLKPKLEVFQIEIRREDLNKTIGDFRLQISKRDLRFGNTAKKLYNLLLAPAERQIAGKNRLIISPDAALWELPFQALIDKQNKYVVETAAVSYAPSLSVLTEITKHQNVQTGESTLLAFGNPAYKTTTLTGEKSARPILMKDAFADLPEAEKQVGALSALYGAKQSRIFTGASATETEFKKSAAEFEILHLATHGVLDDANPLYSYVLLANDAGEDGRLEAREIMQMNLKAYLVVLSACETARGRIGQGEGLVGLSWSFFVAGSPTTVASQWKVESASTTEIMVNFYRRMQKDSKPVSKAEALRQSSLAVLKNERYAHPFYWAGFVIIGDGR